MDKRYYTLSKTSSVIVTALLFVSAFLPYISVVIEVYPYTGSLFTSYIMWGYHAFVYGGWFGLALNIISSILKYKYNILLALKLGGIGCIFIGISIIYVISNYLIIYRVRIYNLEIGVYLGLISWISLCITHAVLYVINEKEDIEVDKTLIKNVILELGTKYDRLNVDEISEKSNQDSGIITSTINEMIGNNEIYAEYFSSTKMVAFNKQANLNEIDTLMAKYKEWEKGQVEKIE